MGLSHIYATLKAGEMRVTENTTENVTEKKPGWRDKTLKAAGFGYMLGDISMVTAGLARSQDAGSAWKGTVGGAATWFLGGIAAAIWGNPDPYQQLKIQAGRLEAYMQKRGVTIPDDARGKS